VKTGVYGGKRQGLPVEGVSVATNVGPEREEVVWGDSRKVPEAYPFMLVGSLEKGDKKNTKKVSPRKESYHAADAELF